MKKFLNMLMALISAIGTILTQSAINEPNGTALCGDMVEHLTQMNRL